jgi:hypothetical protein
MKTLSCLGLAVLALGGALGLAACGGAKAAPAEEPDDASKSVTSLVNATSVVGACPDSKRMNTRAGSNAINRLVEPCVAVPGGRAHFSATLLPGGKIELASPEGNTADGVVPTCVLHSGLRHKVQLRSPCTFDVQLEERKVNGGGSAPAPASSGTR